MTSAGTLPFTAQARAAYDRCPSAPPIDVSKHDRITQPRSLTAPRQAFIAHVLRLLADTNTTWLDNPESMSGRLVVQQRQSALQHRKRSLYALRFRPQDPDAAVA